MPKRCYNREIKEASEFTCGICNATFKTLLSFVGHFRAHRMTSKNYYDQFYRTEKDGICKVCGKQTKYATLSTGYRPICSKKCGSLNWAYCNQQANIGKKQSAETKRKRSQTLMGHRLSEATKKKIGDANRGKKMSAEACKAIAEGHKGKPSGAKGRKQSPEEKEQRRKSAIRVAEEFCKKHGSKFPFKGKKEVAFLEELQKHLPYNIDLDFRPCGYILDGYVVELNLAIEFDERWHNGPAEKKKDALRQSNIQKSTGCTFHRVSEDDWKEDSVSIIEEFKRLYC